jgi:hypothetical protein
MSTNRYANTWPKAGVLSDVRKLVTQRIGFFIDDAVRAFETSADPKSGGVRGERSRDHESPSVYSRLG